MHLFFDKQYEGATFQKSFDKQTYMGLHHSCHTLERI